MFLMYIDESGDPGLYVEGKNSQHYILSGLILNMTDWTTYLDRLKKFRRWLDKKYKLSTREEIHASELIRVNKIESYKNITKSDRIEILRLYSEAIPKIFNKAKIINVCLDKNELKLGNFKNFSEYAWHRVIQRFDRFLSKQDRDKGIIIADDTDEPLIRNLLRRMRFYNPVKSNYNDTFYNSIVENIIEDPFLRNSKHSYFIQTVDVLSHLLYRKEYPKGSLKKFNLHKYFFNTESILLKESTKKDKDNLGIVRK
ncbi:MAG: hypothetical protein A2086_14665 [Spirochaetes bacterium GWD1_27_9]|nr:MAG: hypothetical protein A2Z98_04735 [Spirochaetes bacterium GWB1_27_13]OHD24946.1 MAG: hypothetical protein A2Y34_06200 [Spirochaetes bacterium GWC1_27_15]OHD38550.1 MAG: hypothetical protein A2086_14665 [Spirochaetes bacterium GWD1_27_9]